MTYNFGDILVCLFPFSNHSEYKKRPVVVISSEQYHTQKEDLIVLAITSKVDKLLDFEAIIEDWDDAGLFKVSGFKSLIFTITKKKVYMKLGTLSDKDQLNLVKTVKQIIQING
jgi:mRNA interferase MazF